VRASSGQLVQTWNSETCPAGHPVLAVKFSRTYRALVTGKVIVTVLPVEGLNVYPADATIVAKLEASVLPWTDSVWVRVLHELDGGRSSTIRLKLLAAPRSTWSHRGNALLVLSQ
jgi:hypothetical protein